MEDFVRFYNGLNQQISDMAKKEYGDLVEDIRQDAGVFLEQIKDELEELCYEYGAGELDKGQFELLLLAKKELFTAYSLMGKVIAKKKIDEIWDKIIMIVLKLAIKYWS